MADLSALSSSSAAAAARAQRFSRTGDRPYISSSMSIDQTTANSPPAHPGMHRMSVASMARRPSVTNDQGEFQYFPPLKRIILGRPARVFWDLERASIGGKDYVHEIMRTIQKRVEDDTGHDIFEIYASYQHSTHIPSEVYQELVAYDVNFNLVDGNSSKTPVEDDLYEQIDKFIDSQSLRTHLFPYVLLIAGNVPLIDKVDPLEKRGKIVYAIRKDKDTNFGASLGRHIVYEYFMTKGIQNRIN